MKIKGNLEEGTARILLLLQSKKAKALVNKKQVASTIETVNKSKYVLIKNWKGNDTNIEVTYE